MPLPVTEFAAMLKVTVQSTTDVVTLKLEGKLASAWVNEVTNCARDVVSAIKEKRIALDLTAVTYIDEAGKRLLGELSKQGVCLISDDPLMDAVVDDIGRRNARRGPKLQTS